MLSLYGENTAGRISFSFGRITGRFSFFCFLRFFFFFPFGEKEEKEKRGEKEKIGDYRGDKRREYERGEKRGKRGEKGKGVREEKEKNPFANILYQRTAKNYLYSQTVALCSPDRLGLYEHLTCRIRKTKPGAGNLYRLG